MEKSLRKSRMKLSNESDSYSQDIIRRSSMKKQIRTIIALLLTTSMLLGLPACGKKSGSESQAAVTAADGSIISTGSSGSSGSASGTPSSYTSGQVVKESDPYFMVNTANLKVNIPDGKEVQYSDMSSRYIVGDKILAQVFATYKMPPEVEKELNNLNLEKDADWDKYTKIQSEYEERSLQIFDFDGNMVGKVDTDADADFYGAYPLKDGEILIVCGAFEAKKCATVPKLFVINGNGEKLRDIELQIDGELSGFRVNVMENGNILLSTYGSIYLLDPQGKLLGQDSDPQISEMVACSGGKWYAVMPDYGMDKFQVFVKEIDPNTGKLTGDKIKSNERVMMAQQGTTDCFLINANGIDKYDIASDTTTPVLLWKDTDVNSALLSMEGGYIASEDEMYFFQQDLLVDAGRTDMDKKAGNAKQVSLVSLKKAASNPHAGKTILKLGVNGNIDSYFLQQILDYNINSSNPARIVICDYTANAEMADTYDQYMENLNMTVNQLNLDMISGNGPDILVGYSDFSQFNNDDMLIDLNSYMDQDSSISRQDYFDNIFRAFETNGKLYSIPLTFSATGYVYNKKLVPGAKEKLTFSEFDQLAASLPADKSMISATTYDALLKEFMMYLGSHFINNQDNTVDFESSEFKSMLEFIKKLGQTKESDDREGLSLGSFFSVINGGIAATSFELNNLQDYTLFNQNSSSGNFLFTGAPSENGMNMSAHGQLTMSISSTAADPQLAWNFISSFLKEDVQKDLSFNSNTIPVNRAAFEANCQTEIDVNNAFVEDMKNQAQNYPDKVGDLGEFCIFDDGHKEQLTSLITSIESAQSCDLDILNIVMEEAAAFFADQRSVDDVCKNIQNRATLIVQERG